MINQRLGTDVSQMLMAQALHKDFGSRRLFADLSWQIQPGERLGLIGPNGAGKTTLMRIIMGEELADSGTVSLGTDETRGYLPQEAPRVDTGSALERVLDGAREVQALGAKLAELEAAMTQADAETACQLAEEHADVLDRYVMLDGYSLQGRAEDALRGLGFSHAQAHGPVTDLSGGWWMRVELARLLIARPDYLLLDEPTNHLDTASLDWLENFLKNYPGAWIIVSHDRYFLNRTVGGIAELGEDGIAVFPGNYDFYVEAQAELEAQRAAQAAGHKRKVAELEAFITRFRAKASKAKQAQSRAKTLERMGPPPPGPKTRRSLHITLSEPPRAGVWIARLSQASKAYGPKILYKDLDLLLNRGDKVAIVGVNGAGKSTLLKMLAGVVPLDSGERETGHNVTPYYFAQHQLEMLDAKRTVLEEMQADWPEASPTQLRGLLGAFLFRGDVLERRVGVLSGGEKSRLALAKMMAKPANLLLLDEPTNHLDLASRDILESALAQYKGTVVCISHDRYFINRVANRVWAVGAQGALQDYPGDYDAYLWRVAQNEALLAPQADTKNSANEPMAAEEKGTSHKERKAQAKQQAKHERALKEVEAQIAQLEARMADIDALMCDPKVYNDTFAAQKLLDERREIDSNTLPGCMERWEELGKAVT